MDSKYSLICSMDFHELTLHTMQLKIFVPVSKWFAAASEVLEAFLIALQVCEMCVGMVSLHLLLEKTQIFSLSCSEHLPGVSGKSELP